MGSYPNMLSSIASGCEDDDITSGNLVGDSDSSKTSDVESSSNFGSEKSKDARDAIIRYEERAVNKTRILVCSSIVLCALGIILAVHFSTKQNDLRSFELKYEGFTDDILALVQWEVRYNFALMEHLSTHITVAAAMLNSTFPFHTEPQFEMAGGFVDGMGGIMSAGFAPLVTGAQREEWEDYSVLNQAWIKESARLERVHPSHRDALHGTIQDHEHDRRQLKQGTEEEEISPFIYKFEDGVKIRESNEPGKVFAPMWQVSPADSSVVNVNLLSDSRIVKLYDKLSKRNGAILSQSTNVGDVFSFLFDPDENKFKEDPHGIILAPVHAKIEENPTVVGLAVGITPFGNLLDRLLPEDTQGIIGVLKDRCGLVMSFELSSGKARFLGYEDFHEAEMDEYERVLENIEMYTEFADDLCAHDLHIYPSQALRDTYLTQNGGTYATIVGIAAALGIIFFVYDLNVTRRQQKTMQSAMRSRAIVNSLFPQKIAKQMVDAPNEDAGGNKQVSGQKLFEPFATAKNKEIPFQNTQSSLTSKPLADLFPEATVMFGDLVGFTAWSSLREPHQVFTLLETIYSSFDAIAARRRVFKVETIGDCYVAVAGLPTPRKDHATIIARFASECCKNLPFVLHELEVQLGPDTSTLGIRIGLHSGPVTAGVLRGERARFQLFGDTVNTTSRIESTGEKNKVHLSEDTANYLIAAGKEHWVVPREDKVSAKGKGELNTFWLRIKNDAAATASVISSCDGDAVTSDKMSVHNNGVEDLACKVENNGTKTSLSEDQERIVSWVVDILRRLLINIATRRAALGIGPEQPHRLKQAEIELRKTGRMAIDEVEDVIQLPKYHARMNRRSNLDDTQQIELSADVVSQLFNYVRTVAQMYRQNPFHCFEHASHVLMSCSKLLSRIVSPDLENLVETNENKDAKALHDHTYGITSDPLTQFSVILSALIHDLDHPGVPNTQLTKENDELAVMYNHKSAAEQHSIDAAWELLMEDCYSDLRGAIYATKEELQRFRQLTVNAVMATDIMDKELGLKRKARWNRAFSDDIIRGEISEQEDQNRKATIVIEHIIQASDVAHTMQHWHIYKKWNERLFRENYLAYKAGRATKNPVDGWYEGEIGFFDYYIIPLAKKLESCGVFGVSSDEYLSYAVQNRKEWVKKGKEVVAEFAAIARKEYS